MLNSRHFALLSLFVLAMLNANAQNDLSIKQTHIDFDSTKTKQLLFQLENHNFFKNNEYFGDQIEGYTLGGYSLQPALTYYPTPYFRLTAGIHLQQYNGTKTYDKVLPVLSAQVRFNNRLSMIMGAIKGHVHHNMPEPLLDPEWQINRPVETGLQFLYNTKRFKADLWLDWNQFIKHNDTIPEKFIAGLNSSFILSNPEAIWNWEIPLQLVASHRGGQISNYDEPMESLVNLGTGITAEKKMDGKFKSIKLSSQLFYFKDLTDKKERPLNSGYALYPSVCLNSSWGEALVGYWHGHDFFSPKGNPLFISTSTYMDDFYRENRDLITLKYNYNLVFKKQLKFNFGLEAYYDLKNQQLEYFYGLNLIFTPSFKIMTLDYLE